MKVELLYLLGITYRFSEVYLFVVATDNVASDHGLRLGYYLKHVLIERSLHYTVVKLNDEHILFDATQFLGDELHILHLVVVETSTGFPGELSRLSCCNRLTVLILGELEFYAA